MSARRAFATLATATGLIVGLASPAAARAEPVQKKSVEGVGGGTGTVIRFAENRGGRTSHSVTMTATDADGQGGRCIETWVDYQTKPHQHLNPGVLVNCSGDTRRVAGAVATDYDGVVGMAVVVCVVPDSSGRIARNETNCRGSLSAIHLHSGQRYDDFRVEADQYPSGVRIWRR